MLKSSSLCVLLSIVRTNFSSICFYFPVFSQVYKRPKENEKKNSFLRAEAKNRNKTIYADKFDFWWTKNKIPRVPLQALASPNTVAHQLIVRFVVETFESHNKLERRSVNNDMQRLQFNWKIQTATERRTPADDFTVHTWLLSAAKAINIYAIRFCLPKSSTELCLRKHRLQHNSHNFCEPNWCCYYGAGCRLVLVLVPLPILEHWMRPDLHRAH